MPYIKQSEREALITHDIHPQNAGQLNYTITSIIHQYIQEKGLKYNTLNECVGVLECAKLELYRQIAAPYEDEKRVINGKVSLLD